MHMDYCLATFDSEEVERLSGLSKTMQRDWRRREYIADYEGKHAKYDIWETFQIIIMKILADRGMTLAQAKVLADQASKSAVWFAIAATNPVVQGEKHCIDYYNAIWEESNEEIEKVCCITENEFFSYALIHNDGSFELSKNWDERVQEMDSFQGINIERIGLRFEGRIRKRLLEVAVSRTHGQNDA